MQDNDHDPDIDVDQIAEDDDEEEGELRQRRRGVRRPVPRGTCYLRRVTDQVTRPRRG
jgi:hypothetical protein